MIDKQKNSGQTPNDAATLRKQAEEQARTIEPIALSAQTPEEIEQLIHELQLHQIELEIQNEELRTAQALIETGRARYFDIYDQAPVGYCALSEKGLILEVNLTAATMLGVTRSAMVKQPISRFILNDDQDILYLHRKQLFETGKPQECELRLVKPDGTNFWAHLTTNASQSEGAPLFRVVIIDITERKKVEDAQRESEEHFRSAFEHSAIGMALVSPEGKWLKVNKLVAKIVGYTADELMGKTFQEITHPEDLYTDLNFVRQMLAGEIETYQMEKRYIHKDGHIVWGLLAVSLIRDKLGTPRHFISQIQDITEQKMVEDALRKSEELLNATQSLSKVGGWEWNIEPQTLYWTEETYRIHDFTPGEMEPGSEALINQSVECYEPEARPVILAAFQRCVEEGQPYDLELPFTTATGRQLWIRTTARPVRESGKVIRVIGNIIDITELKRAEEALLAERKRLEFVIDGSRLGTWAWNVQTNEVIFSEAWADMLGYTLEELMPTNIEKWIALTHPEDSKKAEALMACCLADETQDYACELRMKHKDGHWVWILTRGRIMTWDATGKPLSMFGTHDDITDRKHHEQQLAAALIEKEVLLREVHHRVKNNLAAIISLINMQRQTLEDSNGQIILTELSNRIRTMSLVHEKLYRADSLASIDFHDYIQALVSHLRTTFGSPNIIYRVDAPGVTIPLDQASPCGLIVNELVTNALKYAFPDGKPRPGNTDCRVLVRLHRDKGTYTLTVADNGIGWPAEFDWTVTTTLGLTLVSMLGQHQLGGHYVVDRENGTSITLTFTDRKKEVPFHD